MLNAIFSKANAFKKVSSFGIHLRCPLFTVADKYVEVSEKLQLIPHENLLQNGWEKVRSDFIDGEKDIAVALDWSAKVLDYNVRNGKKIRPIALLKAYCTYAFDMKDDTWKQWDSEGWKSAVYLGWCTEILQTSILMADDMMDQSQMRRGAPCWYKLDNIGNAAFNDILLLYCGVYKLLQKHFGHMKCYSSIQHEFLQSTHQTVYGQCLDVMCNPQNGRPRFEYFSPKFYQTLVEYKAAYYTFCLPVHLAMHLAGESSTGDYNLVQDLCLKIGLYYHYQDDYLDIYGDPNIVGNSVNDIAKGKATWLAVKFLEIAPQHMKKEFLENYGIENDKSIAKVLELYEALSIKKEFHDFEDRLMGEINSLIGQLGETKGGLFYHLHSIIRKREK